MPGASKARGASVGGWSFSMMGGASAGGRSVSGWEELLRGERKSPSPGPEKHPCPSLSSTFTIQQHWKADSLNLDCC